jgi:hypothetical protein
MLLMLGMFALGSLSTFLLELLIVRILRTKHTSCGSPAYGASSNKSSVTIAMRCFGLRVTYWLVSSGVDVMCWDSSLVIITLKSSGVSS